MSDAHKGDFGRVLVVGGSRGMIGAPALATNAALRVGAGLATVAAPDSVQLAVATLCPCATSIPLPQSRTGSLNPRASLATIRQMGLLTSDRPTVVAGGPGLGRGDASFDKGLVDLWIAFMCAGVPLVLDADALNAMSKSGSHGWSRVAWSRLVITPHPGELARMQGVTTKAIQADRGRFAVQTARELGARSRGAGESPVVVLKGAGTIVTDGRRIYTNRTGNPGMATGGSGDVLTGLIAGLIAQGLSCFDAAVLGVHVHGKAGDLAAKHFGHASLIATDILDQIPAALRA
ncbi:MAG: NAD(P)H-hydrate dehydratase [Planctomycetes bacterium]|nr:NAD(P)H-hydrate dehydratase [Planctomycetota bacterium]